MCLAKKTKRKEATIGFIVTSQVLFNFQNENWDAIESKCQHLLA